MELYRVDEIKYRIDTVIQTFMLLEDADWEMLLDLQARLYEEFEILE